MIKVKRIHFSKEDDLLLSREVLGQNPFEDPKRWNLIQVNILQISGKQVSARTLRDRIRNLMKKFLEKDKIQKFKSGTEEETNELDDLIRQIVDLFNDFNKIKISTGSRVQESTSYQKGRQQREDALKDFEVFAESENFINEVDIAEEITVDIDIPSCSSKLIEENIDQKNTATPSKRKAFSQKNILNPIRKRTNTGVRATTINYLVKKNERSYEIRCKEIALQERKQVLDEKKFELDKWEREKKIKIEEKKVSMDMDIFTNQQKLIEIILDRFKPSKEK